MPHPPRTCGVTGDGKEAPTPRRGAAAAARHHDRAEEPASQGEQVRSPASYATLVRDPPIPAVILNARLEALANHEAAPTERFPPGAAPFRLPNHRPARPTKILHCKPAFNVLSSCVQCAP